MSNRLIRATSDFARQKAGQTAAWAMIARKAIGGFIRTMHYTVLALGIFAIGALGIMFAKPEFADRLLALSPFADTQEKELASDTESMPSSAMDMPAKQVVHAAATGMHVGLTTDHAASIDHARQQQWVTAWLSKRYRVASDATNMLVSAAYMTAKELKLDPLLILSVMAIESRFNPFAESPVGAQGLMQVMSKVHRDKFEELGGVKAALNPVANIRVGSLILKDYVTRGGSVEAGLKLYVGAGALENDAGYGAKVLAEYHRLKEVAMGKKVSIYSTSARAAKPRPPAGEKTETASENAPGSIVPDQPQPLAKADHLASL